MKAVNWKNTRNVSFWIKSEMCVAFHSLFFVGNEKEASQFWGLEDQRKTVTIGCLKELIVLWFDLSEVLQLLDTRQNTADLCNETHGIN